MTHAKRLSYCCDSFFSEHIFYLVSGLRAQSSRWFCKQLSQWKVPQLLIMAHLVLVVPSLKDLPVELLVSVLPSVSV